MEITPGILQTLDKYKLQSVAMNQNKQISKVDSRQKQMLTNVVIQDKQKF